MQNLPYSILFVISYVYVVNSRDTSYKSAVVYKIALISLTKYDIRLEGTIFVSARDKCSDSVTDLSGVKCQYWRWGDTDQVREKLVTAAGQTCQLCLIVLKR